MTMSKSEQQKQTILSLFPLLESKGVPYWLCGGWVVDLVTNGEPREHYDIDAFIWNHDSERVKEVMLDQQFDCVECSHPDESDFYRRGDVIIDFLKMVKKEDGNIYTPDRWYNWGPASELLSPKKINYGSASVSTIHPKKLIELKMNFAKQEHGDILREKDQRDIVALKTYYADMSE